MVRSEVARPHALKQSVAIGSTVSRKIELFTLGLDNVIAIVDPLSGPARVSRCRRPGE